MKLQSYIKPACEKCETVLHSPNDGVIIKGNIYSSEVNSNGKCTLKGLTGNNFPESDIFSFDKIRETAYCKTCLTEILGL